MGPPLTSVMNLVPDPDPDKSLLLVILVVISRTLRGVVEIVERQCCGCISVPLCAYGATIVYDPVGVYLEMIVSVYRWWF